MTLIPGIAASVDNYSVKELALACSSFWNNKKTSLDRKWVTRSIDGWRRWNNRSVCGLWGKVWKEREAGAAVAVTREKWTLDSGGCGRG